MVPLFPLSAPPLHFSGSPRSLDPPWNSLTLPSPVPYWNPSKTSPDFIILWSFSWCLCHVLSLTHLVAPHARPVTEVRVCLLLHSAPGPAPLAGCDAQSSPQRVLNNVCWIELDAAGAQCISAVISGASERWYPELWLMTETPSLPYSPCKGLIFSSKECLPKGTLGF